MYYSMLNHPSCTNILQSNSTGVFYFTLGNLSPRYRSKYSNIYLLAICKRTVITEYSMSSVLRPIIDDLKCLVSCLIHMS